MTDQFDLVGAGVLDSQGLKASADPSMIAIGVLLSIDADANRMTVAVNGSAGTRLPFLDGIYTLGQTVTVLRNPLAGGRSLMVLGPTKSATIRPTGTITAVDSGANTATVTVGAESFELPYIPVTTFSVSDEVYVLREPRLGGRPTLILGPCDVAPAVEEEPEPPTVPTTGPTTGPTTETATVTILPTYTGTYRADRSAWDRWNTTRYGGRSTLYQGAGYGSGALKGLACYGNQILALGASSIEKIEVRLRGADLSLASYPSITVQGSSHGSRPSGSPSSSGDTVAGSPGRAGAVWVELPASVVAAFLAGTVKGLCTVGSGYNAARGTSSGDGMALRVTYTRPA